MNSRFPATLPWAATVVGLAVVGCFPNSKTDVRKGTTDAAVTQASYTAGTGGSGQGARNSRGQLIAPKRCGLTFVTLSRPSKDPSINESLWRVTDEQIMSTSMMRTMQANGMRVGVITGAMPVELEKVMNPGPTDRKPETVHLDLPDGDSTNVALTSSTEPITLLLNRDGKTFGKDYDDAKGMLRIVATQDGEGGVKLKIVPLIQHGPNKQGYAAAPTGAFQPQEFMLKNGQAEELFRDIAATVTLQPGQVLAIGGRGEPGLSLGGFLFNQADAKDEKVEQHVVLVWAQPNDVVPDESAGRGFFRRHDREKEKEKKVGGMPATGFKGLFDSVQPDAKKSDSTDTKAKDADKSTDANPSASPIPTVKP